MFRFFGREACGILAPRPGIQPITPAYNMLSLGVSGKLMEFKCLAHPVPGELSQGQRQLVDLFIQRE